MATVVTYLLVSDPEDPEAVRSHPILEEHDFEVQSTEDREAKDAPPALKFAVANALDDSTSLETPCRELSAAFPDAIVTYCEIKERFEQVEHLRSIVFIGGQQAGEIEHGHLFNVGA